MQILANPWAKLLVPLAGIGIALLVARLRGVSYPKDLGLRLPTARMAALVIGGWIVWMALSEVLIDLLKLPDPDPWDTSNPTAVVLRILAIGFAGPFLEELLFRGFLFWRLSQRLGPPLAIVVLALVWAVIHYRYAPLMIAVIFLDGVILGVARWKSDSLLLPIAMHMMGNLFSIYQSLS